MHSATRVLAMIATCTVLGCSPMVLHPARVKSGPSLRFVASTAQTISDTTEMHFVPPVGAVLGIGIRSADSAGGAFRIGVLLPAFIGFPFAHLDGYAQLPARPDAITFGVGATLSTYAKLAYVEVGKRVRGEDSWYAAAGYGISKSGLKDKADTEPTAPSAIPPLVYDYDACDRHCTKYWHTQIGYDMEHRRVSFFVAGAFGRSGTASGKRGGENTVTNRLTAVSAGVLMR